MARPKGRAPCNTAPPAIPGKIPLLAARPRRLAALGTSLQLKARFGVGYTLTLSRQPAGSQDGDSAAHNAPHSAAAEGEAGSAAAGERADTAGGTLDGGAANEAGSRGEAGAGAAALTAVVQQHVPGAQLLSATGGRRWGHKLPRCWLR